MIYCNYNEENTQSSDQDTHNTTINKPEIEQPRPSTVNPSHPQEMPPREG